MKKLGRPKAEKPQKELTTIRVDPDLTKEIEFISEKLSSKKATLLYKCIQLGYEELKKTNKAIFDCSNEFHKIQKQAKRGIAA